MISRFKLASGLYPQVSAIFSNSLVRFIDSAARFHDFSHHFTV